MKKTRRVLAILIGLLLISLSTSALAEEVTLNLDDGDITIEMQVDGTYSVQQKTTRNHSSDTSFTVTQNDSNTATGNTITIKAAAEQIAKVTLSGVNIDVSDKGEAAVSTGGDGNVIIELDGENTLKSGNTHAGLEKNNGGKLTIAGKDKNGKLTATGGNSGAGIGGGVGNDGSDITISGGIITAKSGGDGGGAGIGGGLNGNGSNITISGGNVTAMGTGGGAGIGGGANHTYTEGPGNGGYITISGGTVKATSDHAGAGIGGGWSGKSGKITFSGKVKATVQGGDKPAITEIQAYGTGAGIGDGGSYLNGNPVDGTDLHLTNSDLLDVSNLEAGAIITCYEQGTEIPKSILYQIFKANILTGDTIEIQVSKVWEGENDAGVQSITVGLYADGTKVDEKDITPNEGIWYHNFGQWPLEDNNSKPINYTIVEEPIDGYTPHYFTSGEHGGRLVFRVKNVPTDNTGAIRVSKELSGEGADKNKEFAFTVTLLEYLGDDEVLDGGKPGYYPLSGIYTFGGFEFRDGKVTFGLKGGQSVTISGIPAEYDYTVTESNNAGYTVTSENDKGTIRAKDTAEVKFTNTKSSTTGNGSGHSHYHPYATPVPVTVIPPKTGDMTIWQSILHFLGIR